MLKNIVLRSFNFKTCTINDGLEEELGEGFFELISGKVIMSFYEGPGSFFGDITIYDVAGDRNSEVLIDLEIDLDLEILSIINN